MYQATYGHKLGSPSKEAARGFLYSQLTKKEFLTKQHIVIASREVGDGRYLTRFSVKKKNIIACDVDRVAVAQARRFGLRTLDADIQDTVALYLEENGSENLASINVDLCATIDYGAPVLNEVLGIMHDFRVPDRVKVFFTFVRSRYRLPAYCSTYGSVINGYLTDTRRYVRNEQCFQYQSWTSSSRGSPMTALWL